jgi:hypothetical protein
VVNGGGGGEGGSTATAKDEEGGATVEPGPGPLPSTHGAQTSLEKSPAGFLPEGTQTDSVGDHQKSIPELTHGTQSE